jgi:PAS domain S-box-containing protein
MVGAGTESQSGYTLLTAHPVIVEDIRAETRFKIPPMLFEHGVISSVSVPVTGHGRPFCCLCALSATQRRFTQDDVHFLQGIANGLAAAIERQRAEAALRQGEERFRIALKHAPIVLFNQDAGLRYTWVSSPEGGFPSGAVLGKTDSELLPAEEAAHLTQIKGRVLKTGVGVREEVRTTLNGQTFYYDLTVEPLCDRHGTILGITCAASDITERKRVEEEMAASLKDRDALLREVHHRVKNNLQVICSLLDLQCGYIKDSEDVQMFKDSQNRIRSIALVHEQLHRSKGLAQIDCSEHMRTLATQLFRSYGVSSEVVRLNMEMDKIGMPPDTAILCGLIVSELVSNTLRHAFPGGRKGEMFIGVRETDSHQITVVVKDNGIGFPEDLDFRDAPSLGLTLVNLLTDQLRGTIHLTRQGGTTFEIVIPLREPN